MKKIPVLFAFMMSLSACHHVYYAPNTANAPLLNEKGETRINALYTSGGSSEYDGGELQFAHAVGKNVAVMVNGFTAGTSEDISDYSSNASHTEKGSGSYIEAAAGLFKNLHANKKWVAELYGGFGVGSVANDYGFGDRSKVAVTKFFLQPAIGYKARYFEVALVSKISKLNWKIKENRITASDNNDAKGDMAFINRNNSNFLFEPALIMRVGGKGFKVQGALSFSNFNKYDLIFGSDMIETQNASLGISINLKSKRTAMN